MSAQESSLALHIDTIESSYEYMLAYAAQGRDFEPKGGDGPPIRDKLADLRGALAVVAGSFEAQARSAMPQGLEKFLGFCAVLKSDAERAMAALDLVLAVDNIGSQLIDNLNASLHLRALLTDMFLLDEALKTLSRAAQR